MSDRGATLDGAELNGAGADQGSRIIAFSNIGHSLDHLFMLILPTAVLGMTDEFGRSFGEIMGLALGGFIAFGAGSMPSGWLGDRWSRRHMMGIFFIGIGAAALLTSQASGMVSLGLGLFLIGAFASIYHPVGIAMLVAEASRNARTLGRSVGLNGVFGNLGVAAAALLTGALTQWYGWRMAYIVPGLASVAIGCLYLFMVRDERRGAPKRSQAVMDIPASVMRRAFFIITLVAIAGATIFNSVSIALPKVFDERLLALVGTPLGVGVLLSMVYLFGAVSQLIIGAAIDRFPIRQVFVPLAAISAPSLLVAANASNWVMLLATLGVIFAMFGQVTINDAMIARYTADAWRARAYSLRYLLSFTASASAVPLVALLRDGTGSFVLVFQILGCLGALIFVAALFFPLRREELEPLKAAAPAQ